jgi:nitroreductase
MHPIPSPSLLAALRWRYATKKFDPTKKIPAQTWTALEQSLVLAPSSFGLQPWKFFVVQDPALRVPLAAASYGQNQVVDCSHLVVFAVRRGVDAGTIDRYVDRIVEVRGGAKEKLKGFRDVMVGATDRARGDGTLDTWMTHQIYIALGQFMTAAALLQVDTCPMEGIEPETYDAILGLPGQGFNTVCACPAGYRAADDKYASAAKVRFATGEVVSYL